MTSLGCTGKTLTLLKAGKYPRMRVRVQGSFMQARFIEIHKVFAKKKVGYFHNKAVKHEIREVTMKAIPIQIGQGAKCYAQ